MDSRSPLPQHENLRGTHIKLLKVHIITGILAVACFAAFHYFHTAYQQYSIEKETLKAITVRHRLMQQQQQENQRKQRVVARVNRFSDQAEHMGLRRDRWSSYDVSIAEPMRYPEIRQILNQCTHAGIYYFKPVLFQMTAAAPTDGSRPPKTVPSGDSEETKQQDAFVSLKGTFIVKEE